MVVVPWGPTPGQTLLQTGERQGRTDHGEMERAKEREPDQGNMHADVPADVYCHNG